MYQFNPRFSDKQTIGYMDNYYRNPRKFNQQQVQMLANHARFYGIDFEPIDE
jgi:hypothetical protein